jgi:hypothetical protein
MLNNSYSQPFPVVTISMEQQTSESNEQRHNVRPNIKSRNLRD